MRITNSNGGHISNRWKMVLTKSQYVMSQEWESVDLEHTRFIFYVRRCEWNITYCKRLQKLICQTPYRLRKLLKEGVSHFSSKLVELSVVSWNSAGNVWQDSHSYAGSEMTLQAFGVLSHVTSIGKSDTPKGFQSPSASAMTYITLLLQPWQSKLLAAITSPASCREQLGVSMMTRKGCRRG